MTSSEASSESSLPISSEDNKVFDDRLVTQFGDRNLEPIK